jgi:hypothetical protein
MGLLTLKTKFKSLKYGNNGQVGGTKQPFIKTPVAKEEFVDAAAPFGTSPFSTTGVGLIDATANEAALIVSRSGKDIIRLGKFFTTTPGLLFIAKQNLLSQTNVRTQANEAANPDILINAGPYTPTNTLAQVGVSAAGLHFYKQGLTPNGFRLPKYGDNDTIIYVRGGDSGAENRLVELTNRLINVKSSDTNILTYQGGPGADLGVGQTVINVETQRTGKNNPALLNFFGDAGVKNPNLGLNIINPLISNSKGFVLQDFITPPVEAKRFAAFTRPKIDLRKDLLFGLSNSPSAVAKQFNGGKDIGGLNLTAGGADLFDSGRSVYQPEPGQGFAPSPLASANSTNVYNQEQIVSASNNIQNYGAPKFQDFRAELRKNINNTPFTSSQVLSNAPSYDIGQNQTINGGLDGKGRIFLGNPGSAGNIFSYTEGKKNSEGKILGPLDRINAKQLYNSRTVAETDTNDLVKFRIEAINNKDPEEGVFIHFRAFIDSFSDNYTADWSSAQYVGRGEKFYTYNTFDRTINMSWTIAAQSKQELIPMYQKLNFLASNLMPDYSEEGYMRGSLVRLTVGGYLYSQPGFITSLTYDVPSESPWEIGINDTNAESDNSVKELPHIIRVSGFNFTPIHNFVPRKQTNTYAGTNILAGRDNNGNQLRGNQVSTFGPERFIALNTGDHNNYDTNNYI